MKTVKDSAYHIIDSKSATYFAIGQALVPIVRAILSNQKSALTASMFLDDKYDLEDVCLGMPCIASQEGVESVVIANLARERLRSGLGHRRDLPGP